MKNKIMLVNKIHRLYTGIAVCVSLLIFSSCETESPDKKADAGTSESLPSSVESVKAVAATTDDGVAMAWENKDAIVLRCQPDAEAAPTLCTYTATLAAPKATATFKKKSSDTNVPTTLAGKYIAFHPAAPAYVEWAKTASVIVAPGAVQSVKNKKVDKSSAIMIASSDDSEFSFRHVTAYVKFTITSTSSPFGSITVTSGDNSQCMVSRIKVNLDEDFSYSLITGESYPQTSATVSLVNDGKTDFLAGTYYIAVNPASYSKGLKVTFENQSGHVAVKEYKSSYLVGPGDVIDLGEMGNLGFQMSLPHIKAYTKNNQRLGVVFYQDPSNAGIQKVVSANCGLMKWASTNDKWRIHNYKTDYDYVHTVVTSSDAYRADADDFPAVKLCEQMRKDYGGNWHVPSLDEMNMLFNAYYGKAYDAEVAKNTQYTDTKSKSAASYFDSLLESMGASALLDKSNDYWICGQNSNGNMQYVNMKVYNNGNVVPTEEKTVRCVRDVDPSKPDDTVVYPQTGIGKLIKGALTQRVIDVTKDETKNIANGLEYYKMTVMTDAALSADRKQTIYLLRADLTKGLDLKVAISKKTTSSVWQLEKLSDMASAMSTSSKPVYAMINADFCDQREPINPRGPVHCSGKVWSSVFDLDPAFEQQGLSYVGVKTDGKMTIGYREDYSAAKSSLKECTGAGVVLLQEGKLAGHGESRDPRTGIGYTSSNIVWMLVVDGRHGTSGMTYSEMGSIFQGLGCDSAVALDGGGSSEMITRNPSTGKIEVCNWPSDPSDPGDGGQERPRLNAWAIVKK